MQPFVVLQFFFFFTHKNAMEPPQHKFLPHLCDDVVLLEYLNHTEFLTWEIKRNGKGEGVTETPYFKYALKTILENFGIE